MGGHRFASRSYLLYSDSNGAWDCWSTQLGTPGQHSSLFLLPLKPGQAALAAPASGGCLQQLNEKMHGKPLTHWLAYRMFSRNVMQEDGRGEREEKPVRGLRSWPSGPEQKDLVPLRTHPHRQHPECLPTLALKMPKEVEGLGSVLGRVSPEARPPPAAPLRQRFEYKSFILEVMSGSIVRGMWT